MTFLVATTSLPAVDRPNADRWNAARSCQKSKQNKALGIIEWGGVMKAIIFPLFIFFILPLISFNFEKSYFILMS